MRVLVSLTGLVLMVLIALAPRASANPDVVVYWDSIIHDDQTGTLINPSLVYADPHTGEIYVIDGKSRILIFSEDYFPLHSINSKHGIDSPQGLAVDKKGNLYVAQAPSENNARARISVISACLKKSRDIYFTGFEGAESFVPTRLAIDDKGRIYAVSQQFKGVVVLYNSGALAGIMTPVDAGKRVSATNVSIDRKGNIYIVSAVRGHVYVYDNNRELMLTFGEKGGSIGKLSIPRAVAVDHTLDRMYIVDYMRHTITSYDMKGTFLFEFGGLGTGRGWFQFPTDITVDGQGRILIADFFNNRIQIFATR